jgi:hypothetical protein
MSKLNELILTEENRDRLSMLYSVKRELEELEKQDKKAKQLLILVGLFCLYLGAHIGVLIRG